MTQGILVVECDGLCYQVIGSVINVNEAVELARDYENNAGPEDDDTIPPDRFVLMRRNANGRYAIREEFNLETGEVVTGVQA